MRGSSCTPFGGEIVAVLTCGTLLLRCWPGLCAPPLPCPAQVNVADTETEDQAVRRYMRAVVQSGVINKVCRAPGAYGRPHARVWAHMAARTGRIRLTCSRGSDADLTCSCPSLSPFLLCCSCAPVAPRRPRLRHTSASSLSARRPASAHPRAERDARTTQALWAFQLKLHH